MSISTCACICTYLFVLCSLCVCVFMKSKGQPPVLSTGMLFICFELNIKWFPVSVSQHQNHKCVLLHPSFSHRVWWSKPDSHTFEVSTVQTEVPPQTLVIVMCISFILMLVNPGDSHIVVKHFATELDSLQYSNNFKIFNCI